MPIFSFEVVQDADGGSGKTGISERLQRNSLYTPTHAQKKLPIS
jgi:hypothetical protein